MAEKSQVNADKLKVLSAVMDKIEKDFGKGSIMRMSSESVTDVPVIPTGSITLDIALGVGGYPKGRVIEIYGPESSGKTTLAIHAIAEAQKNGGIAAIIDAEHAFDRFYAQKLGVDVNSLLIAQPDNGEQALEIAEALVRSGITNIDIVDYDKIDIPDNSFIYCDPPYANTKQYAKSFNSVAFWDWCRYLLDNKEEVKKEYKEHFVEYHPVVNKASSFSIFFSAAIIFFIISFFFIFPIPFTYC